MLTVLGALLVPWSAHSKRSPRFAPGLGWWHHACGGMGYDIVAIAEAADYQSAKRLPPRARWGTSGRRFAPTTGRRCRASLEALADLCVVTIWPPDDGVVKRMEK